MKLTSTFVLFLLSIPTHCHGQNAPLPVADVDLKNYGWSIWNNNPQSEAFLSHAVDFSADGTFWAAFPAEKKGLIENHNPRPHHLMLLHLSSQGAVLTACPVDIASWKNVALFAGADTGIIISIEDYSSGVAEMLSLDDRCGIQVDWTPTGGTSILQASPDRKKLYTFTGDSRVREFNSQNFAVVRDIDLPKKPDDVSFGDDFIEWTDDVMPASIKHGCWLNGAYVAPVVNDKAVLWKTSYCNRFMLLDDTHLLVQNDWTLKTRSLQVLDDNGARVGGFDFPKEKLAFFMDGQRSWDRIILDVDSEQQDYIDIIDLSAEKRLLHLPMSTPSVASYALSVTGKSAAILQQNHLLLYALP